jgi:hypothetical protein
MSGRGVGIEVKSAERQAFELYLRTGRRVPPEWFAARDAAAAKAEVEAKYNPWHDRLGRFTFPPGGPRDDAYPERRAVTRSGPKPAGRSIVNHSSPSTKPTDAVKPQVVAKPSVQAQQPDREIISGSTISPSPVRSAYPAWMPDYPDKHRLKLVTPAFSPDPFPAPDGAFYVVPKEVTEEYLNGAIEHLQQVHRDKGLFAVLREFHAMYRKPAHPHFIDFKRWGAQSFLEDLKPVKRISYFSPALGQSVTASPYESFGNWFYGFAGTYANIPPEILKAAAWLVQERKGRDFEMWLKNPIGDSLEDVPHVDKGMNDAIRSASTEYDRRIIGITKDTLDILDGDPK